MVTRIAVTNYKVEAMPDHTILTLPHEGGELELIIPIVASGNLGLELFTALAQSMPLLQREIGALNAKALALGAAAKKP